jgi:DNA-binding LacI/PurR family transcriptional regulator
MTDSQARPARAARVTIGDVARAAGVRPSTVSKALNGGRGSPDVRDRVERAAAELGYRPNEQARGLRQSQSRSLGLLIPDLANPVYLPLLRGAERAARDRGYVVLVADGQRSDSAEAAALERFFDQGVDGLLLAGPVPPGSLARFVDHGVPVAPPPSERARAWERAEGRATRAMAHRLVELGHRHVTFIAPPQPKGAHGHAYRRGRLGVLSAVLREADAELTVRGVDPALGFDECRLLLRPIVQESPSTAMVCADHLLVPSVLAALADASRRLPDDLSLVAYGDSDWARAYLPPVSVVGADLHGLGDQLATALLDAVAGLPARPYEGPTIRYVERGTVGPPSAPFGASATHA